MGIEIDMNAPKTSNGSDANGCYTQKLCEYAARHNISIHDIMATPKLEYRYFGYRYTPNIRRCKMHHIPKTSFHESVLVEFRTLPNLEFIVRNAILKLPHCWAHTIVCGTSNYDSIRDIVRTISLNVRIIQLPHENITVDQYSELFTTVSFWELFKGEKLLIYQEDSCIFKKMSSNDDPELAEFLKCDYIGAPWPKYANVTACHSGNGGFSLRSKSVMIRVLRDAKKYNYSIDPSPHVLKYMKCFKLNVVPEDITIVELMHKYGIGAIAEYKTAFTFSSETIWNPDSFGGHGFWTGTNSRVWRKRLYTDILLGHRLLR